VRERSSSGSWDVTTATVADGRGRVDRSDCRGFDRGA
jgi:hypothetical protein